MGSRMKTPFHIPCGEYGFENKIKQALEPNFIDFPFNEIPPNKFKIEILITSNSHEFTISTQDINFIKFVSALADALHVIVEKFADEMDFCQPQLALLPGHEFVVRCRAIGIKKKPQEDLS